jgi:hypothetical protein
MRTNQDWLEMEDPCGEGTTVGMYLPEWSEEDSSEVDHATAVFQAQHFDLLLNQDDLDGSKDIRHKMKNPLSWISLPVFQDCLCLFNPIHCWLKHTSPWKQQVSFQIVEETSRPRRPLIKTNTDNEDLLNISDWCQQGRQVSPTSIHGREKQEEASAYDMYLDKKKPNVHISKSDHNYGMSPIGYQEFVSIGYQEFRLL